MGREWLIIGAVCGLTLGQTTLGQAQSVAVRDTLVDIGGRRLHLHCVGVPTSTGPTVLFEAGGGGTAGSWLATQERLATRVHSCAYDRAGSGRSDPGPGPRTLRQQVFELELLLQAARLSGPFVLVGHSMGGLLVRLYTAQHQDNVAGMVLVEPAHESSMLGSVTLGRWVRLRELATDRPIPAPRRNGPPSVGYDPAQDYTAEEFQAVYLARRHQPVLLDDRPLIVLGAGVRPAPPGTPDSLWRDLRRERDEQVRELTTLSRNSRFVLSPNSTHDMPSDDPDRIAQAVLDVVTAIRAHAPLGPQ
jgi:pimeloyl-ACP methyl ester carboxylesterase